MSKLIAALAAGLLCVSVTQAQVKKPMQKPAAPVAEKKLTPQQLRMRSCNKQAKEKKLKGAERRKFMSGCLKKH